MCFTGELEQKMPRATVYPREDEEQSLKASAGVVSKVQPRLGR